MIYMCIKCKYIELFSCSEYYIVLNLVIYLKMPTMVGTQNKILTHVSLHVAYKIMISSRSLIRAKK